MTGGKPKRLAEDPATYTARKIPNDQLKARSKTLERKISDTLAQLETSVDRLNLMPQAELLALRALQERGVDSLWIDSGKINNLDKSVMLDNVEALVEYTRGHRELLSAGPSIGTLSLDERSFRVIQTLAEQYKKQPTDKTWKGSGALDPMLNGFGAREAVRRSTLLSEPVSADKGALERAVREMSRLADTIVRGAPVARKPVNPAAVRAPASMPDPGR